MLDQQHADRRQLRDLAAAEPATGPTFVDRELVAAPAASVRIVIDDLIDLVLGHQPATRAPMPRLAASLALGALPGRQLLGLRTRLRTPLPARLSLDSPWAC